MNLKITAPFVLSILSFGLAWYQIQADSSAELNASTSSVESVELSTHGSGSHDSVLAIKIRTAEQCQTAIMEQLNSRADRYRMFSRARVRRPVTVNRVEVQELTEQNDSYFLGTVTLTDGETNQFLPIQVDRSSGKFHVFRGRQWIDGDLAQPQSLFQRNLAELSAGE